MSHTKQAKEEMDCSICLTEFKRPTQLPCLHTFCLECLKKYCDQQGHDQTRCPLCSTDFHLPSGGVESLPDSGLMPKLVLRKTAQEGRSTNSRISICETCVDFEGQIGADSFCPDCRQKQARKLVRAIVYKPHTDDKESLLSSDSNITIVPHKPHIVGLAVINNEIFVALSTQMKISAYDSQSLTKAGDIEIPDMKTPVALAGCSYNKALYISDGSLMSIHRVDLSDYSVTRWKMRQNEYPRGLSVTAEHTLLVTVPHFTKGTRGESGVVEYLSDGQRVREIGFHSSILCARHTIRLSSNQFIVCHALDAQGGVCVINNEGQVTKSYDRKAGPDEDQTTFPLSLAIDDKSKRVFVADNANNKILQLDTDLRYVDQVHTPHDFRAPFRLHYDPSNQRLLVGEYSGRLLVVSLAG